MKRMALLAIFTISLFGGDDYYTQYGKKVQVAKIVQKQALSRDMAGENVEYYMTSHGKKVGVTNEIIVKCRLGVDCAEIFKSFSLSDASNLSDSLYFVKIPDGENVFTISNRLSENPNVEFAHPNFIKANMRR